MHVFWRRIFWTASLSPLLAHRSCPKESSWMFICTRVFAIITCLCSIDTVVVVVVDFSSCGSCGGSGWSSACLSTPTCISIHPHPHPAPLLKTCVQSCLSPAPVLSCPSLSSRELNRVKLFWIWNPLPKANLRHELQLRSWNQTLFQPWRQRNVKGTWKLQSQ